MTSMRSLKNKASSVIKLGQLSVISDRWGTAKWNQQKVNMHAVRRRQSETSRLQEVWGTIKWTQTCLHKPINRCQGDTALCIYNIESILVRLVILKKIICVLQDLSNVTTHIQHSICPSSLVETSKNFLSGPKMT